MPLSIACTQGHEFKVAASRAGSTVRCPHCREKVLVVDPASRVDDEQPVDKQNQEQAGKKQVAATPPPVATDQGGTPPKSESATGAPPKQRGKKKRRRKGKSKTVAAASKPDRKAGEKAKPTEPAASVASRSQPEPAPEKPAAKTEATPPAPPQPPAVKDSLANENPHSPEAAPPKIRIELPSEDRTQKPEPAEKIVVSPPPLSKKKAESDTTKPNRPPALPSRPGKAKAEKPAAEPTQEKPKPANKENRTPATKEPAAKVGVEKIIIELRPTPEEEPAEPETAAASEVEPAAAVVGFQHDSEKLWSAWLIGISLGLVGAVTMIPSIWSIVDYFRFEGETPIPRWAWFLLFTGFLQIAYAVYVSQLPDFSSVWMTAITQLVIATTYAMSLGMILLGGDAVLGIFEIHVLLRNKAGLWVFSLLCMTGLAAYFCGRVSVRWQRAFELATGKLRT